MRRPSRTMPPSPGSKPFTWVSGLILAGIAAGFGTACYHQPLLLVPVGLIILASFILGIDNGIRLDQLATEREGESICTFARSFDFRRVDTWILRAVFEELQPYCKTRRGVMPLRRSDDFETILQIDDEDLEDLIEDIAFRAGRSLDDYTQNPFLGQLKTVADLVAFLMHQPKTRAA